jgi:hypothetical protein
VESFRINSMMTQGMSGCNSPSRPLPTAQRCAPAGMRRNGCRARFEAQERPDNSAVRAAAAAPRVWDVCLAAS